MSNDAFWAPSGHLRNCSFGTYGLANNKWSNSFAESESTGWENMQLI